MCAPTFIRYFSKDLNDMTKGVQGLAVLDIFFFQPPNEMWVKGFWNVNKLFLWSSCEGSLMVPVSPLWIANLSGT